MLNRLFHPHYFFIFLHSSARGRNNKEKQAIFSDVYKDYSKFLKENKEPFSLEMIILKWS